LSKYDTILHYLNAMAHPQGQAITNNNLFTLIKCLKIRSLQITSHLSKTQFKYLQ